MSFFLWSNWAVLGALLHCSAFRLRASFDKVVAEAMASLSSSARLKIDKFSYLAFLLELVGIRQME